MGSVTLAPFPPAFSGLSAHPFHTHFTHTDALPKYIQLPLLGGRGEQDDIHCFAYSYELRMYLSCL